MPAPKFKLTRNDDGTATVCDSRGVPLTLDSEAEGAEPEAVTVALDGFQAVEPDPLAGLADNPHVKALQDRLAKAEAAAAQTARNAALKEIKADAASFHRDLTDGKAPRLVGKLAQDARTLYEAAAQHDLDHPPADGKPGLSAQLRDFCLSLPPIDTAEHGDSTPEDAEDRGDGTRTLSHRTETPGTNGPLSEADFKAALASTPEGKALLSDAGKYAGHLAEMRAAGLVK